MDLAPLQLLNDRNTPAKALHQASLRNLHAQASPTPGEGRLPDRAGLEEVLHPSTTRRSQGWHHTFHNPSPRNSQLARPQTYPNMPAEPAIIVQEQAGQGSRPEEARTKEKSAGRKGGERPWLPEGEVTYQPFSHPLASAARKSSRTTASDSSNLASEPSLQHPSPEADGSNNGGNSRASHLTEPRRERSTAVRFLPNPRFSSSSEVLICRANSGPWQSSFLTGSPSIPPLSCTD